VDGETVSDRGKKILLHIEPRAEFAPTARVGGVSEEEHQSRYGESRPDTDVAPVDGYYSHAGVCDQEPARRRLGDTDVK